jgi:uncharacterized protein (DUF1684 family)
VIPFERIGRVELPGLGSLDVWWAGLLRGRGLPPAPRRDRGSTTYGGGRYLLDTVKGADLGGDRGRLLIDLNFAYNPSCAYDPSWTCPLAPEGNRLDGPVEAGERAPLEG